VVALIAWQLIVDAGILNPLWFPQPTRIAQALWEEAVHDEAGTLVTGSFVDYLDMIAAARRTIYIENQYFTAPRIAQALERRLGEPDGPEIVLVLRLLSHGWLEEATMHVLRTRLIQRLQTADRHGRFRVYYPHVPGLPEGNCVDVHSKLLIIDDALLRIGSSNLCNRSMALDTECDLVVEARGQARIAQAIGEFRDKLLAEHLDTQPERVREEIQRAGSVHGAIAAFREQTRTLRQFDGLPEWPDTLLSVASVADPEEPIALETLLSERQAEESGAKDKPAWGKIAGLVAVVAALMALVVNYDAALHAVFVGFVFSMVFGHAPVIFPAVLRVAVPYHPSFYVPLALLHGSLAVRLAGDAAARYDWTRAGGLLNALANLVR